MQSNQQQAAKYWNRGTLPANICRLLNITHRQLSAWVQQYPDLFRWQGYNNPDNPVPDLNGRMPLKAPGTEGVPQCMILHGMCRFPLWGDDQKPTVLSLMCGEPALRGKSWCRFHHRLCCETVSDKPLPEGDQA